MNNDTHENDTNVFRTEKKRKKEGERVSHAHKFWQVSIMEIGEKLTDEYSDS